jgi:NAD-dependent DNA ligase
MEIVKNIINNPYSIASNLSIEELETVITLAADKFFNTDKPIISDEIYDLLIDILKEKSPKSKILKNIGAKSKNKVKLDYWLGSMNKLKPGYDKELEKWINKYSGPYYISDKLDGVSALLIYRPLGIINLYTRGTASQGTDISNLIKYLNLPKWDIISKTKEFKINNKLAFRGELIIKKEVFTNNWSTTMKNARNAVSGLVNSKNIKSTLANDTSLILYEVIDQKMNIENQLIFIKKLDFEIVMYKVFDKIDFTILSKYLKKRRTDSEYFIDGIIIMNNDLHKRNTKDNPDYAFAYKDILEDQIAITTVKSIEWNISKDGYIKPTLILESVSIGGVEISRVTGHNARYIVDNKLGKNAEIEIIRSGDVIPYIQKIIKPAKKEDLPKGDWHWNETNIDIISNDLNSNEIIIKNIYFFFSTLETKGLGEKNVEKLVKNNFNTILKIIQVTKDELIQTETFKEKTASNIIESIKKSLSNITLSKIMAASNILGHGIGEEKIKIILNSYPNILIEELSNEELINKLIELNGWEEKTSKLFASNFNEFKKFYNSIKEFISFKKINSIKKNKWSGKIIVFSGFRDKELKEKLENFGAIISNNVTKTTDYLIIKTSQDNTSKVKKAKELNIQIIEYNSII